MNKAEQKQKKRQMRHKRIRARVRGSAERPRLAIFRSNRYCYAQVIDDTKNDFPIIEDKLPIIINDLNDKAEELIKEICKEEKSFLNVISGGLLGISKCVIKDTPETIEKEKQLEKILEERQDKLIDLIKTDPEKISEITNLEKEREKLPDNLKDLIEKEVKINGVLEIVGEKFSIIRTDTPAGKKRIWIYFTISPKIS